MKRVKELIEKGEDETLDFKKVITSVNKIAKTIVSFANHKGGTILVGVNDDKTLYNIEPDEEIYMLKTAAEFNCEPSIELTIKEWVIDRKTILEVKIPRGSRKPFYALNEDGQWRVYIRVKDRSLLASKVVVDVLHRQNSDKNTFIKYGSKEQELLSYLERNDKITLKEFCDLLNIGKRRATRILVDLVSAGAIRMHTTEKNDFYTLS
ncbi:MAG: AlbA family DNA-binding domain-containing protein [Bacteroidia bacterium]